MTTSYCIFSIHYSSVEPVIKLCIVITIDSIIIYARNK
jgi:hypothetical protein